MREDPLAPMLGYDEAYQRGLLDEVLSPSESPDGRIEHPRLKSRAPSRGRSTRRPRGQRDEADGVYLLRADEIEAERVDYLDQGLIPLRVVTLVTGVDGVGKSTMLYTKAAAATRGTLPGTFIGEPVDVVIASSEDHPGSVIKPRLIAARADLERVHLVKCRRHGLEGDIALPDDLPQLEEAVKAVGARLLIIDPLVAHLPVEVDSHKAQHVRSVLAPLAHLAEESRLAIAAVVHFNGSPSTEVRSRISGSKALRDASRSVLVCGVDPGNETRFVMVQDKNSFGPRSEVGIAYRIDSVAVELPEGEFVTSKLYWEGEVRADAQSVIAGPGRSVENTKLQEAEEFLLRELGARGGIGVPGEIKASANEAGIPTRTLERARPAVADLYEPTGTFPRRTLWKLRTASPSGRGDAVQREVGDSGASVAGEGKSTVPGVLGRQAQSLGESEPGRRCGSCGAGTGVVQTIHGNRCGPCSAIAAHGQPTRHLGNRNLD